MSLSDVTFTEARTISGRKVNLIVANKGTTSPSPQNNDKVKTLVLEQPRQQSYMEGLHQVITSESPVKKVSDIIIKPKVRLCLLCIVVFTVYTDCKLESLVMPLCNFIYVLRFNKH